MFFTPNQKFLRDHHPEGKKCLLIIALLPIPIPAPDNRNAIIIGPSETGKSFTAGALIPQRHERACRQVNIDAHGACKNTLPALNGKQFANTYFEYGPDRPLPSNPFSLPGTGNNATGVTPEKVNFIITVRSTIRKGGKGNHHSPAGGSVFQTILKHYCRYLAKNDSPAPNITSFYKYCQTLPDLGSEVGWLKNLQFFNPEEFLTVLLPFVERGYTKVLNADHTVNLADYPLVCFDQIRQEIKQFTDIRQVYKDSIAHLQAQLATIKNQQFASLPITGNRNRTGCCHMAGGSGAVPYI